MPCRFLKLHRFLDNLEFLARFDWRHVLRSDHCWLCQWGLKATDLNAWPSYVSHVSFIDILKKLLTAPIAVHRQRRILRFCMSYKCIFLDNWNRLKFCLIGGSRNNVHISFAFTILCGWQEPIQCLDGWIQVPVRGQLLLINRWQELLTIHVQIFGYYYAILYLLLVFAQVRRTRGPPILLWQREARAINCLWMRMVKRWRTRIKFYLIHTLPHFLLVVHSISTLPQYLQILNLILELWGVNDHWFILSRLILRSLIISRR